MSKDSRRSRIGKRHSKPHPQRAGRDRDRGIVTCRKCGKPNTLGTFRCTRCNSSLRPVLLEVTTIIGPIWLLLASIVSLVVFRQTATAILTFLVNLPAIVLLIGLRYGRCWAWIGIQFAWAISIVFGTIYAFALDDTLFASTIVNVLVTALFFMYFHTKEVKNLCSVKEFDKTFFYVGSAALILYVAGVPFLLGKYFEFNSPGAFDSGSYVYSAKHVLSGARIGYEEKPSAQAGTLLFNMLGVKLLGFSETGSEVLQMLLQAVALTVMFITVRRLYGVLAAIVSTTVASVYLSAPLIAKFGNVKEQFMIAFMVLGICCFIYYQLSGKWWWVLLTGALLIWGPMFKQTGLSAIAAVGLFVLAQPAVHRTGWKRAGKEVLLLAAGAAITMTPICLWYASMGTPLHYWPYSFIVEPAVSVFAPDAEPVEETATSEDKPHSSFILRFMPGYIRDSWEALSPAQKSQAHARVQRYYKLLILPILLALGAIVARVVVVVRSKGRARDVAVREDTGRLVPLLAVWWFFDMAFVWISPRSYEQYYLPLNASGAFLGSYLVGLYAHRYATDSDRPRWTVLGLLGVLAMLIMSWHIFFGIRTSPHSGVVYKDRYGQEERRRGYVQKWGEVSDRRRKNERGPWEIVGEYIRERSDPTDTIYVWGWFPGIYVQAQRMTSAPKAFEGMMHTLPPEELARRVREILDAFEKQPPKFIVDSRKSHFPWDRPPLELWPRVPQGLTRQQYEQIYAKQLADKIEPAEARRFEAMAPFRRYVMNNYEIVRGQFGTHVLFRRK